MEGFSPTDPLLQRARELVDKKVPKSQPTLWLKPPGDTALGSSDDRFWHPWYPEHQRLLSSGWTSNEDDDKQWEQIVLFGGRFKEENRELLQAAQSRLTPDGRVYYVLPNEYGAKSVSKELRGSEHLLDDESGRKSRLFTLSGSNAAVPWFRLRENKLRMQSAPGLFCWEDKDRGSTVLAEALKDVKLKGSVADLGAGWGYLSAQLPESTELHLVEADKRGLDACRANLSQHSRAVFHWADASRPNSLPKSLQGEVTTVITNPPFHTGKKAEPVLGGAFVATAHQLLKRRGECYLVGNSHLPYRRIMSVFFTTVDELTRANGYSVYRGVKK